MRFSEILFVHERHGRVEQSATSAAPAHAVVDDEPAQMGDTSPQVFPIDGKRSDNPPILDGEPDFVAGLVEAIAKFREAPSDDGLEALAPSESAKVPLPPSPSMRHSTLLAQDAFVNPGHLKFALRGCLAAGDCYMIYNSIAWSSIGAPARRLKAAL